MIKREGSFKYLEIKNISKNFGETFVLKNIHLDVFKGEFLCLLGPSGCGKTTLLRIISGLERQTNGDIVQDGLLISNSPTEKRDFGIVFQSYALFPNLNAKQNIAYGLENKKINKKEIEKRTNNLLRLVGLEKYSDQFPSQLSGGQQQRVALARAMALSPGLLLLDEPLSALDAQVRSKLRNEIKLIQKKLNLTTIMVTHDQTEALSMADRVVVMERGHIAQIGTPSELYENPITPFVADFIGKMNLLKGKYDKKNCVFYYLNNRFLISQNTEYSFLENCLLGIRPEDIEIIKFRKNIEKEENILRVKIKEITYLGTIFRLTVVLESKLEENIFVDVISNQVISNNLKIGDFIDCLLYTSPSPRDREKSRMPSSA